MIGLEIFLPGGILGICGSVVWISAAVLGFQKFPAPWNWFSAVILFFFGVLTFVVWIRYFPKSRVGKNLSLSESAQNYKSHTTDNDLPVGTEGEAESTLRPSGIARFDGKRLDVVADAEWIEAGQSIKISSTTGGHVSVVKT